MSITHGRYLKLSCIEHKTFKCPICGCDKHYYVDFIGPAHEPHPISTNIKDLDCNEDLYTEINFKSYVCKQCGHIETFVDYDLLEILNNEENSVEGLDEKLKQDIDELNKQLLEAYKELDNLKDKKETLIKEEELEELIKIFEEKEQNIETLQDELAARKGDLLEVELRKSH